jgi:hypothetical protein
MIRVEFMHATGDIRAATIYRPTGRGAWMRADAKVWSLDPTKKESDRPRHVRAALALARGEAVRP